MIAFISEIKARYELKIVFVSNEARVVNDYRIHKFKLDAFVDCFISSCCVHLRKPDADIFRLALDTARTPVRQGVYIENTPMIVQIAEGLGIRSILHTDYKAAAIKLQEEGTTAVFVAIDGKPAGILAVADPIKSTTLEAVRELHELELKLVMLTGDNRRTTAVAARELGLDAVQAEIEPAGKVAYIKKLRVEAKHVAMAGDGVNDAPALSEAEVGIAMGAGTDVAMQSAGIALVKGAPRGIAQTIRLSRATMRNIRQNLCFAFLYNALGIPLAAGILYPFVGGALSPIIAGAAMSLSSVSSSAMPYVYET
jgi:P-type E1-E2 ATPase